MNSSSKYINTVLVNGAYQADFRENNDRRNASKIKFTKLYDRRLNQTRRQSSTIDVQV